MRITMIMGNTPKVGTSGLDLYRTNPQAGPVAAEHLYEW
jgi:hypothetical protein